MLDKRPIKRLRLPGIRLNPAARMSVFRLIGGSRGARNQPDRGPEKRPLSQFHKQRFGLPALGTLEGAAVYGGYLELKTLEHHARSTLGAWRALRAHRVGTLRFFHWPISPRHSCALTACPVRLLPVFG